LKNPHNGNMREAPVGFSWTVLFFGIFPPMFRSDWKGMVLIWISAIFTLGFSGLIWPFFYNKLYICKLISDGFKVVSVDDGDLQRVGEHVGRELPMIEEAQKA